MASGSRSGSLGRRARRGRLRLLPSHPAAEPHVSRGGSPIHLAIIRLSRSAAFAVSARSRCRAAYKNRNLPLDAARYNGDLILHFHLLEPLMMNVLENFQHANPDLVCRMYPMLQDLTVTLQINLFEV